MITCPSCNHQNPEGSLQCENCYTPLPATTSCPNCGASVQTDATFCGQCGFNLQAENSPLSASIEETAIGSMPNMSLEEVPPPDEIPLSGVSPDIMPETPMSSPIKSPWDENEIEDEDEGEQTIAQTSPIPSGFYEVEPTKTIGLEPEYPETEFAEVEQNRANEVTMPWEGEASDLDLDLDLAPEESPADTTELPIESEQPEATAELETSTSNSATSTLGTDANRAAMGMIGATQLQVQTATLLHLQSNTTIEIPSGLDVVHIGKPNGQIPPDIDVAGFPDSEVVSRVHADIRIEGDAYFIEDVGSSNGTYINHAPLLQGNRHRLRAGDRIAMGKGDLVTFIFQLD